MKLTAWIAALALATKAGIAVAAAPAVDVRIDSGRLQGRLDGTLATFQGIRYAAPPVGERRWRAPAPVAPWPGETTREWGRAIRMDPAVTQRVQGVLAEIMKPPG